MDEERSPAQREQLWRAHFTHPDGSWYRLWMTSTAPKTAGGHRWHVHASYDKTGTVAPIAGTRWYDQLYGMHNWDFDQYAVARDAFQTRASERLMHGYELREGELPPTVAPDAQ